MRSLLLMIFNNHINWRLRLHPNQPSSSTSIYKPCNATVPIRQLEDLQVLPNHRLTGPGRVKSSKLFGDIVHHG